MTKIILKNNHFLKSYKKQFVLLKKVKKKGCQPGDSNPHSDEFFFNSSKNNLFFKNCLCYAKYEVWLFKYCENNCLSTSLWVRMFFWKSLLNFNVSSRTRENVDKTVFFCRFTLHSLRALKWAIDRVPELDIHGYNPNWSVWE